MTSVLLNGGLLIVWCRIRRFVALDDVSVTEWRRKKYPARLIESLVALDDVSVTEWRFLQENPSFPCICRCTR